jgi:predicted nucleic acid-binding protein
VRIGLDTNIPVYAEGVNGEAMARTSRAILAALPTQDVVLPVQVLGELFAVLTRKAGRTPTQARDAVMQWRDSYATVETSSQVLLTAIDLAADHHFAIWDAIIMAAVAEADCRLLLSEDLQDGFSWRGVTVVNPFAEQRHPLLTALIG